MKLKDVVVMIADGEEDRNGRSYSVESVLLLKEPVILTVEFDRSKIVGSARLRKCGDRILAELFLFTSSAIAKSEVLMNLVPAAGGILRGGKFEISEVAICANNADHRIQKFSKYIARKEALQHATQV